MTPDYTLNFRLAAERFGQTFEASVQRNLLSDVPIASYLSGGFDSASVASKAATLGRETLHAYTGHFDMPGTWYDETSVAKEAVDNFKGMHRIVPITADNLKNDLDRIVDALDEPKMGMGAFPQYLIAENAAKDFKAILTGHGGDELFSGYPVFKFARTQQGYYYSLAEMIHFAYFLMSKFKKNKSPEYLSLIHI